MVGVGENHLGAGLAQAAGVDAFDRALRADRHEGRHLDGAVRRVKRPSRARRCWRRRGASSKRNAGGMVSSSMIKPPAREPGATCDLFDLRRATRLSRRGA